MNLFEKGKETEDKLKKLFDKLGIFYEDLGREYTIKQKDIQEKLNQDNSATASFVRYQPDLLVLNKEFFFAEVKTGATIKKECFENYLRIEKAGINILIFFLLEGNFYYCKPSEVPFYQYPSKDGLMFHKKANVHIPVDGVWCFPVRMKEQDFRLYKKTMNTSGNSFAFIHKNKLKLHKIL